MERFQSRKLRFLALLLIPSLAFGPIGCGAEAIPLILSTCAIVSVVAITIYEVQSVQSAFLDIEMKRIRLEGMRNGERVSVERALSGEEVSQIASSGKVCVNGQEIAVSSR